MWGWGSTSRAEGSEGTSTIGSAWSMKIKGPTMRRWRNGRMRFTFTKGLIVAGRLSMTSSSIKGSVYPDGYKGKLYPHSGWPAIDVRYGRTASGPDVFPG